MRTAIFELVFFGLLIPSSALAIASENCQLTEPDQTTFGQGEKQLQSEQFVLNVDGPLKMRALSGKYKLNSENQTVNRSGVSTNEIASVPAVTSGQPIVKPKEEVE